jgi:uncharacterized protein (TIRG00374 family)
MKSAITKYSRYLPLVLGLAILIIAATLVPWSKVLPYLLRLSPLSMLLLLGLSALYYFGKIARYWLLLKMLGQKTSFRIVALACLVAQPVSILPGGELYRGIMLKRYGNVALSESAPGVFAQSLTESLGLVIIALIGASILHRYVGVTALIAAVIIAIISAVNFYNGRHAHRVTNVVPGVNLHHSRVRAYLDRNQVLLSGKNFLFLFMVSLISTGSGIAILGVSALSLGHGLSLAQAAIAFALPTTLEAISFLPGGMGANEGSSVGLLTLFGTGLPEAIALTILVRLFTLGTGFLFGFAAMLAARLLKVKQFKH